MRQIITFILLLASIHVAATNYYVSNTGSDAASGTSTGTSWQTVAKVNSSMASFNAGDSILFKRGDTWTGTTITVGKAGTVGNNIIISAYGTGAKPIISAAANNPVITVTAASRGYWTVDNIDLRSSGNVLNGMNIAVYFNYWPSDMGSVPGWVIKNCSSNGQFFVSGPNIQIQNNVFNGANAATAIWGAIIIRGVFGVNALIEGNTISNWKDRGIWLYNGVDSSITRYNTVFNIYTGSDNEGMGINVDGYAVPEYYNSVYSNVTYNCDGFGISHENAFAQQTYSNTIYSCLTGGINIHNYSPTPATTYSNGTLHHNLIYDVNIGIGIAEVKGWSITNNTIHRGIGSVPSGVRFTLTDTYTDSLTFTNNIISGTWTYPIRVWTAKNVWTAFDYNDIMPSGTTVLFQNTGGAKTLANLQASGFMTHGITSDPLYVSSLDFHLQEASPASTSGQGATFMGALGYVGNFIIKSLRVIIN